MLGRFKTKAKSGSIVDPQATKDDALPPLEGWLLKRHKKQGKLFNFSKRYLRCVDDKGRVTIDRSSTSKNLGSAKVILSFCEISSVEALEGREADLTPHGFRVCCAPVFLTFKADSEEDKLKWIEGLNARCLLWRAKVAAEGPRIAVSAATAQHTASSAEGGSPNDAYGAHTGYTSSSRITPPCHDDDDDDDTNVVWAQPSPVPSPVRAR